MNLYLSSLGEQIGEPVRQGRTCGLVAPSKGIKPVILSGLGAGFLLLAGLAWSQNSYSLADFLAIAAALSTGRLLYQTLSKLAFRNSLRPPLANHELHALQEKTGDALHQSYFNLALSIINLPPLKDETAEKEVQDAMTALGSAIEVLPPWEWQEKWQKAATDDPAALRTEAQAQIENAQGETDAVIAASQRRRAESLLRRADTAARTLVLLRRNRALREEVSEQIKALRTSLTALQIGGRQSTPELSGLAASIHRVALEANAVTVARTEVDTLLSRPGRSVEEAEPQTVRVRI